MDELVKLNGQALEEMERICNGVAVEQSSPYLIPFVEQQLLFFDESNEPITEVCPRSTLFAHPHLYLENFILNRRGIR